eukprot:CAMPEP_0170187522 /NCGR_PEP_ID=MMETSP0040_2-20121228/41935_1 /TAXON_ID=641309 /ORGANISM="Lotharella oceanica, Strain CCMP622" /LENGTH=376 /DNA_ID=CAMNT_0010434579 /DNA_START=17 /DNA_END=1144 /DNA_ORIENTATION=+
MPVSEDTIGMGMPSALRKRTAQSAEAKQKIAEATVSATSAAKGGDDVKQPPMIGQPRNVSMTDAARIIAQAEEDEDRPEETPNEPVKEPTFKVTLKTTQAATDEIDKEGATEEVPISFEGKKVFAVDGFSFSVLPEAKFQGFHDKEVKKFFEKWGIRFHISKYRFHEQYDPSLKSSFMRDLFTSEAFQKNARRAGRKGLSNPVQSMEGKITKVDAEDLNATVTNMGFFDRIEENGILGASGKIRGCFEDIIDDVSCNSLLRQALLNEDHEQYDIFDDDERKELIFRLFRHMVIGGGTMCQYEDYLKPYLDTCKLLYKDLISVCRNSSTGQVDVKTHAYQINEVDGITLFPLEHGLNTCFVCIDSLRKYVTYYYAAW